MRFYYITPTVMRRFFYLAYRTGSPVYAAVITASTADEQIFLILLYRKFLPPRKPNRKPYSYLNYEEKNFIISKYYFEGWSIYRIAKALGRSPSVIYYFLRRRGLK